MKGEGVFRFGFHRMFTNYQHSPLDSANNTCYSTTRTKEEGNKERQRNMKSLSPLV